MKKQILFLCTVFFGQILFAQRTGAPKQSDVCPPPVYKKGQTSAQVREDTRKYVECVAAFNQRQREAREERNRQRQMDHEKRQEQKRREEVARREAREKERETIRRRYETTDNTPPRRR